MSPIDPQLIYLALKAPIANVIKGPGRHLEITEGGNRDDALIDELARNGAQAIATMLDTLEIEGPCPICGIDQAPDPSGRILGRMDPY